jgi:hypothetical protein
MPVGHLTAVSGTRGVLYIPGATASGAVREGAAVALVYTGGQTRVVECSAASDPTSFQGFAATAVADGDSVGIITVRGSLVVPIVEGGGVLTPGSSLFLSPTNGEVSHTPPISGSVTRVGAAISPTELNFNTDARVVRP